MNLENLKPHERILLNAAIVAGITMFSTLNVVYPPTMQTLYAGMMGALLAFLTQLKTLTAEPNENNKQKPKLLSLL